MPAPIPFLASREPSSTRDFGVGAAISTVDGPGIFALVKPTTIGLTAPRGGGTFTAGGTVPITWIIRGGPAGHYRVAYPTNGGASFALLPDVIRNATPFNCTVPNINAIGVRLRVMAGDAGNRLVDPAGSAANFSITPPTPTLTLDRATVAPGGTVTVTVSNAPGGPKDWRALAPAGSSALSYLKTTSVGAGVSERTWTVSVPGPGGAQYEIRLLLNDGYAIVARSGVCTVVASGGPGGTAPTIFNLQCSPRSVP